MSNKVRWGVLSTAAIGMKKVLPAMQKADLVELRAIARATSTMPRKQPAPLASPRPMAPYEELLADPQIEAIYNPLPNQLHVPWSIKAAEAGKHVLCEKPISMTVAEARSLLAVQERNRRHHRRSLHGAHSSAVAYGHANWSPPAASLLAFYPGFLQLFQY